MMQPEWLSRNSSANLLRDEAGAGDIRFLIMDYVC